MKHSIKDGLKKSIKDIVKLFLLFSIVLIGCNKSFNKTIGEGIEIKNNEAINRFLSTPDNLSPDIQKIANDLKKEELKKPFLLAFIKKNGTALWEQTITSHPALTNSINTNANKQANTVENKQINTVESLPEVVPIYFIPLVDSISKEVKSFLYCVKKDDSSYYYKVHNKTVVLETKSTNFYAQRNASLLLGIFASFEKNINHKTSTFPAPYNLNYADAKLTISTKTIRNQTVQTNKIQKSNSSSIVKKSLDDNCTWVVKSAQVNLYFLGSDVTLVFTWEYCIETKATRNVHIWRPGNPDTGSQTQGGGGGGGGGGGSGVISFFGTGSVSGVYYGGYNEYHQPGSDVSNLSGGGQDPNDPFWYNVEMLLSTPTTIFDKYADFIGSDDASADYNFKLQYYNLEEQYSSRIPEAYRSMNKYEFIYLLQSNPAIAESMDPVTILLLAGINGAADVLTQMVFIKLLDNNVTTWNQAMQKIDWTQVGTTVITSFLPWRSAEGKLLIASVNGASAALSDIINRGFVNWTETGIKFTEGFFGSLLGSQLSHVATKFGGVSNIGKSLVKKLDNFFSYATITKWLGGGLKSVYLGFNETILIDNIPTNITLNTIRKIEGWAGPDKIVIIGRKMDIVKEIKSKYYPNAEIFDETKISGLASGEWLDLNKTYSGNIPEIDIKKSIMFKENNNFIQHYKELGYTFIDLGNPLNLSNSIFYEMELANIF